MHSERAKVWDREQAAQAPAARQTAAWAAQAVPQVAPPSSTAPPRAAFLAGV